MVSKLAGLLLVMGLSVTSALASATTSPPPVLATTGMIADLAERVGGECIAVTGLMGPGVDPHLYQPSAADVRRFQHAELVLYNGLGLEGQLDPVLKRFGQRRVTLAVAEAAATTGPRQTLPSADGRSVDPHVWMDPSLWVFVAEDMADVLTKALPDHADDLAHNLDSYRKELIDLDRYAQTCFASIPEQSRVLVTAHDAFNYFGRTFDFEVVGLQGLSTATEAGVKDVQRITQFIIDNNIKAVFIESSVPRRTVEALQAAVKDQNHEVNIGGELYSDALGSAGTEEGTYIGMYQHNVNTIINALK